MDEDQDTDAGTDENKKTASAIKSAKKLEAAKKHYHVRTWLFCGMLVLALVGMSLTMSLEKGGWEFWVFLLAFYGGVSVFWGWRRAKQKQEPAWKMVRAQVFHWSSVLLIYAILVLFERTEIINREAASNVALLVLALACLLAGVHFDWTFLLVGVVLAIMAVSIGYLEQYVVWIIMLLVMITAGGIYFLIRKRRTADHV
jgi:hypothetical protein